MSLIRFEHKGDFSKTQKFLNRLLNKEYLNVLEKYGQMGVQALSAATPIKTGLTAASWEYRIKHDLFTTTIEWDNTNVTSDGTKIVILLQYGHGTRNGGYVVGRDFINPAIQPIFDKMANEVWKEVTKK